MGKQRPIAKISTPRLFGVVARQRLFARLDENRGRPLVWVDGPPGAGKTALFASYLEARRIPTLWYQVEAHDADPANLFHYLTLAAEDFPDADLPALPRLVPEHLLDPASFGRTFFRQLFARLPAGVVIVLDNYQEVPDGAWLHEIVRAAVGEVPPGSSICCVSRSEAPPPFAQLVAAGAFFGLHWEALRLTLDEAREMCAARGVHEDWLVRAMQEQCEGWASGMTLMLERLGDGVSETGALPGDTRQAVFDYFASILFDRATAAMQRTLLAVAFLPHLTASMAQELSGCVDAGEVLDQLYRRHLFTDRRSGTQPVYQFHALFRDFLQARARERLDAAELRQLKARSARSLDANGDIDAAMELWIAGECWEDALGTILGSASGLLGNGRRQTLERWIAALPAEVQAAHPWVTYWLGMARMQIVPETGIATLREAARGMQASGDMDGIVVCTVALLNAAYLGYLAVEAMDRLLDQLLSAVESAHAFASPDVELGFWGALCSALFWSRPWHPWAALAAGRVEALLGRRSDPNVTLTAAASAMSTASLSGDFECGNRIALATEKLVDHPGASPSEAIWWLNRAGYLRFMQARYDESLALLRRAGQLAEANGIRTMLAVSTYHRFMVEFRVAGWSVSNATLAQMEAMPRPRYPAMEAMLCVYQARRAQFRGRRDEAADLAELTHAAILRTGSQYQEMLFGLVDAELLLDAGRIEKARAMIARSRELIQRAPVFDCFQAALVFAEARLAQAEGDQALALERLAQSLSLARERNRRYCLRYLECAMPHLFSLALEEGIEVAFVQQLIRMFRLKPPAGAPDAWPWQIRIRALGRFEVRVDDEPLEFSRKVPKKTLALLKVLVAYGGQEVSERSVCDALWGDEEADAARQALGITVVRLRKLLGINDAVRQHGGKLWLDRTFCWADAWRFEEWNPQPHDSAAVSRGLELYAGTFLPQDDGEMWSAPARERLRGKFIHLLATHGRALEAAKDADGAIRLYLRGIDADPIVEAFHQGLMRCYRQLGRDTEAIASYRRLRQTLSVVLGVAPSAESQALYRAAMAACAERPEAMEDRTVVPLSSASRRRRNRGASVRRAG